MWWIDKFMIHDEFNKVTIWGEFDKVTFVVSLQKTRFVVTLRKSNVFEILTVSRFVVSFMQLNLWWVLQSHTFWWIVFCGENMVTLMQPSFMMSFLYFPNFNDFSSYSPSFCLSPSPRANAQRSRFTALKMLIA